jgi:hypothetical protein
MADGDSSPLFDHFSLPALRDFRYHDSGEDPIWPHPQFLSLLARSSCHLEKLSLFLQDAWLETDDLKECLCHSSFNLNLIAVPFITSRALALLTLPWSTPQADFLLPNLESFQLTTSVYFSGIAFTAMIESRRHSGSTGQCNNGQQNRIHMSLLKKLDVGFSKYPHESLIVFLRKWVKGGLDVRALQLESNGEKTVIPSY